MRNSNETIGTSVGTLFTKGKTKDARVDLEGAHERVVDAHHRAGVVKLAAVVWCAEQRDKLPLCKKLVSVLNDLCTTKKGKSTM